MTSRDRTVVRLVARFRAVETGPLLSLAFPNIRRDTATARLRRLFDAGYLDVRVGDLARPNVYSLGPAGRAFASSEGMAVRAVPRGDLTHHLGITRAWAEIALWSHRTPDVDLVRVQADWELRASDPSGLGLIPDLWCLLRGSGGDLHLAIEVDTGSEPLVTIENKLARYGEMGAGAQGRLGHLLIGLVTLGGSARRRQQLQELLARYRPIAGSLLPAEDLERALSEFLTGALAPMTAPPDASPSGKGSFANVSHVIATVEAERGGGL